MHAPYAAQYWVMGGSGAGRGGSFTFDPAVVCVALAAAVSEAALSAVVIDVAAGAEAAMAALGALAPLTAAVVVVVAGVAEVANAALAPGALAAFGMPGLPIGAAEKLLDGKGGRDGAPVDVVLAIGAGRGGIWDSRVMLTLVLLAAA
jgi:hypothetical protein